MEGKYHDYLKIMKTEASLASSAPPNAPPSALPSAPPSAPPNAPLNAPPSAPSITPTITKPREQPPRIQPPREQPQQSSKINTGFRPGIIKRKYTPEQLKFKESLAAVGPDAMRAKIIREAEYAKNNPPPKADVTAKHALAYTMAVGTNVSTLAIAGTKLILREFPRQAVKLIKEIEEKVDKDDEAEKVTKPTKPMTKRRTMTGTMTGGMTDCMTGTMTDCMTGTMTGTMTDYMTGGIGPNIKKYNKMLFCTAYIPGAFTLIIFAYLVLVMLWPAIQRILNIINKYIGTNLKLPSIMLKKKPAQTVYSIFFVITSFFLMLYLFIDYFRNVGPELDIVQILKQLIGASYILWPMVILIIGSGIAKAFYKISCNGNKPNVLSWAKIVDSFTLNIVVMTVLITVILLLKPIKILYNKITPFIQRRFNFVFVIVAVTLKLMVIYILLRMITVMIENVISNKIVFFLSKLNNDIEPPPVDCNAEEEEKKEKQSEIARILEEIYMYISGIIMYLIMCFFIVIQCPHPWVGSVYKINLDNGAVILKLTDISTRYIVENSFGKKDCSQKKKGLNIFSSFGKTGPQYSEQKLSEASTADAKDAEIQANDKKLGAAQDEQRAQIARALAEGRTQAIAQQNTKGTVAEYSRLFKGSTPVSAPESASAPAPAPAPAPEIA